MISKSCPPFPMLACHCVHGQCDSGLLGTGHCRPDSCHLGHEGQDCNIGKCKKWDTCGIRQHTRDLYYLKLIL